jgi:hypothetical protein
MAKKSKPARGLIARGSKGSTREKLARAAGFRCDSDVARLFPESRQKHVRQLQQALADLVSGLGMDEPARSAAAGFYGSLMRALAEPQAVASAAPAEAPSTPAAATDRASKQASLATDALRQMVVEAVEAPLALLPSLLADDSLTPDQKLQRLGVYTAALEAVYEPLELEPIGEPGETTAFDPRHHESAAALSKGDPCTIRQIGFRRGDALVRKAVVVGAK